RIVSGIIISAVFSSAYMDTFPGLCHSYRCSGFPNLIFGYFKDLSQITVRKAILFCFPQSLRSRNTASAFQKLFLFFYQLPHLLDEIRFNPGQLIKLFCRSALADRLIHDKLALAGGCMKQLQKLFFRLAVEILGKPQTITSNLQASDSLLESFFIGLANAHNLAHGAHLRSQLILHALEFFKSPAGEFDYYIVSVRYVFIQ